MSKKLEEIVTTISKLNILEIVELGKIIEKKFDISSHMFVPEKQSETKTSPVIKTKEKITQSVIMTDYGKSKISVIKIVRTILNLGLKEAKEFVEKLPATIKKDIQKDEAETLKSKLENSGAKIELK